MNIGRVGFLYRRLNFITFFRFLISDICRRLFFNEARFFFAQGGEDIHILYLLNDQQSGFYLDIGSNDPIQYSNTFKLYLAGWNGLLVDGNPSLINKAKNIRKKDICIHALVSNENRTMDFYISDGNLFSSIDSGHAALGSDDKKLEKIELQTQTLDEIIEKNAPPNQVIDLLSIDVEGHDFSALQSISLRKYRPRMIIIEDLHHKKQYMDDNTYVDYLKTYQYRLVSTDKQNLYFMPEEELG